MLDELLGRGGADGEEGFDHVFHRLSLCSNLKPDVIKPPGCLTDREAPAGCVCGPAVPPASGSLSTGVCVCVCVSLGELLFQLIFSAVLGCPASLSFRCSQVTVEDCFGNPSIFHA